MSLTQLNDQPIKQATNQATEQSSQNTNLVLAEKIHFTIAVIVFIILAIIAFLELFYYFYYKHDPYKGTLGYIFNTDNSTVQSIDLGLILVSTIFSIALACVFIFDKYAAYKYESSKNQQVSI